jgi:Icc protein
MIRILEIEQRPFRELEYIGAAVGRGPEARRLSILRSRVEGLPVELDVIVAASDLQGLEKPGSEAQTTPERLLGEVLAEEILSLSASGAISRPDRMGILLGGDLSCRPGADRRGGYRDVLPVWRAFDRFRWLAGLAGNHDTLGPSPAAFKKFKKGKPVHFLDGEIVICDKLKIAGLSGVIGNPRKPFRRGEPEFIAALQAVLAEKPDILILHEGPEMPGHPETGNPKIGEVLSGARNLLVVSGHRRWEEPLAEIVGGPQILNVDERVVLLMRPSP